MDSVLVYKEGIRSLILNLATRKAGGPNNLSAMI